MLFQQMFMCDMWAAFKTKAQLKAEVLNAMPCLMPCYLLIVTSVCKHGHACLLPLKRLEAPCREKESSSLIFISMLTDKAWEKRQATAPVPTWWPDEGFRVQHPLTALHMQARPDKNEAGPCLYPVLKTDEAMVLGPGPPGSLQGPHHWAGRLGLDHSWHATAECNGIVVQEAEVFFTTLKKEWPTCDPMLRCL